MPIMTDYEKKPKIHSQLNDDTLNVAIVGGDKACKFFLEMLQRQPFSFLNLRVIGVCDTNPEAEGMVFAREMGIHTTETLPDLLKVEEPDNVIALTDNQHVLSELLRLRPKGVGTLELNISRLLRSLFVIDQAWKSAGQKASLEKGAADFLIQESYERIVILDTDFTIVDANEPYLKAVGKSKSEVLGSHCYEITHGLSAPCSSTKPDLGCPMVQTLTTQEPAQVIHDHMAPGGQSVYCDLVTYPVKGEDGEIVRIIEIWRDITEELSARWESRIKELQSDMKKLIQEDRMISLGKLVASCVHEINNPIQGLLTFSHLMLDTLTEKTPTDEDMNKFKQFLNLMCKELDRCGQIVSGLLSFSRQSPTEHGEVNLNEVLETAVFLSGHKMELQGIDLEMSLCSSPLLVRGDKNQLQQCVLNLIFNGMEGMPEGGKLRLVTRLNRSKEQATMEISDTGCGIPEEIMDHIFDPFFTTKEEGSGTGLGLSIVDGVVRTHRGKVRVKSKLGKGTTFFLDFPLLDG